MKKFLLVLFVFNLLMPTEVLSSNGAPKDKKWKGEGEVIEFESISHNYH